MNLYHYPLPADRIATRPASPRDHSQLLIVDTQNKTLHFDHFLNLDRYLPDHTLLVLNETKVMPARIEVQKSTGGRVELLLLLNEWEGTAAIATLSDRKLTPGQTLALNKKPFATVTGQDERIFHLKLDIPPETLNATLMASGHTPIPPYIGAHLPEAQLRQKYQTVFAKNPGSIAAPTASLHFTPRLFKKLAHKHIHPAQLTLHVGLGTFAPLTEENLKTKTLHKEHYEIPTTTLQKIETARAQNHLILTVGSTATRALESWARTQESTGDTQLFISPPYEFQASQALITNFHLPDSSLMHLVQAYLESKKSPWSILEIYEKALAHDFRFYSFGDAMLVL